MSEKYVFLERKVKVLDKINADLCRLTKNQAREIIALRFVCGLLLVLVTVLLMRAKGVLG